MSTSSEKPKATTPQTSKYTIKRPTPADLPPDHPFRNPARLAAIQRLCPKYKPMKASEYRAKPYVHPANVAPYGLVEVFPPYGFDPEQFAKGKASWAEIKWPSHAYSVPPGSNAPMCSGKPAVIQISGISDERTLMEKDCFACELVKSFQMRP